MLPLNKETLTIVGVVVCILAIVYLYKEIQKLKKVSVVKPSQPVSVPVYQNWAPAPVNDTKPKPTVGPPMVPAVPPPAEETTSEEKSPPIVTVEP